MADRLMLSRRDAWPLGAIGFILIVSAAWWWLALWSAPGAPDWLERARSVCFNLSESGLPDAKGWLLLLGEPPAMLAVLVVGWADDVRASLARLLAFPKGRLAALAVASGLCVGGSLSVVRVLDARVPAWTSGPDAPAPDTYPRLDRAWPAATGLVAQDGSPFDRSRLGGRPAMVTFAFGHCATLCPVVVHAARAARLESGRDLSIVVVTLDPWRDTPSRLPALLGQYQLDPARDFVVGGAVDAVEQALDAWKIARARDDTTGDITHPALVYFVETDGTIAYGSTGGVLQMTSLARRLH